MSKSDPRCGPTASLTAKGKTTDQNSGCRSDTRSFVSTADGWEIPEGRKREGRERCRWPCTQITERNGGHRMIQQDNTCTVGQAGRSRTAGGVPLRLVRAVLTVKRGCNFVLNTGPAAHRPQRKATARWREVATAHGDMLPRSGKALHPGAGATVTGWPCVLLGPELGWRRGSRPWLPSWLVKPPPRWLSHGHPRVPV